MGNDDAGGCSSNSNERTEERPLKKARYVWEVKGKYHLKPNYQNTIKKSVTDQSVAADKTPEVFDNNLVPACGPTSNNNDESCTNRCCIESFLARTDSLLMDSDDDEPIPQNIDKSISNEIPITLVSPNPKNQDYYLRKWQARQVARAYIDNTINRVLESWIVAPTFDATDFVENCDNDGQVEDEGILMAIQSHGLQRNGLSFVKPDQLAESTLDNFENVQNEMVKQEMSTEDEQPEEILNIDMLNQYNLEFLDAAVCVAIKKKGLSSFKYN